MATVIRPHKFCSFFKEKPYDKQAEIMDSVLEHDHIAIAAANGVGKTWAAARLALWYFMTFEDSLVITTAPTFRQVRYLLWRELHSLYAKAKRLDFSLPSKPLTTSWAWGTRLMLGFAAKEYQVDRFQGLHAPHLFVIVDEASGISLPIYEQIQATLRGRDAKLLMIGNPLLPAGPFFKAFENPAFKTFRITAFDSPNVKEGRVVVPGLVTVEDIERDRRIFGEDSVYWKTRILAEFPDRAENALFALSDMKKAQELASPVVDYPVVFGVDIGKGQALTVVVARKGPYAYRIWTFSSPNTMETTGWLVRLARAENAKEIYLDYGGIGAGVVDRLRELELAGVKIIDVNNAEKSSRPVFLNRRTELWNNLAELIREGRAGGPVFRNEHVIQDLLSAKAKLLSSGKLALEAKERHDSPHFGDATVLAFAGELGKVWSEPVFALPSASEMGVPRMQRPWSILGRRRSWPSF